MITDLLYVESRNVRGEDNESKSSQKSEKKKKKKGRTHKYIMVHLQHENYLHRLRFSMEDKEFKVSHATLNVLSSVKRC